MAPEDETEFLESATEILSIALSVARREGVSDDDAEDVASTVLASLWSATREGRIVAAPGEPAWYSYVRVASRNTARNFLRRQRPEEPMPADWLDSYAPFEELPEPLDLGTSRGILSDLTDTQREIVRLLLAGYSLSEIAKLRGSSRQATSRSVYRIRNHLAGLLAADQRELLGVDRPAQKLKVIAPPFDLLRSIPTQIQLAVDRLGLGTISEAERRYLNERSSKMWSDYFLEYPFLKDHRGEDTFRRQADLWFDALVTSYFVGRTVSGLRMPDPMELLGDPLSNVGMQDYAIGVARKQGLSQAAAEVVAAKSMVVITRAINKDPELKSRMLSSVPLTKTFVRRTVRRAGTRQRQQDEAREAWMAQPDEQPEQNRATVQVQEAINNAGLTGIEAARLKVWMNQSEPNMSELARELDVSEGAVRKSIRNAQTKVRRYLGQHY